MTGTKANPPPATDSTDIERARHDPWPALSVAHTKRVLDVAGWGELDAAGGRILARASEAGGIEAPVPPLTDAVWEIAHILGMGERRVSAIKEYLADIHRPERGAARYERAIFWLRARGFRCETLGDAEIATLRVSHPFAPNTGCKDLVGALDRVSRALSAEREAARKHRPAFVRPARAWLIELSGAWCSERWPRPLTTAVRALTTGVRRRASIPSTIPALIVRAMLRAEARYGRELSADLRAASDELAAHVANHYALAVSLCPTE